jgi:SAM-dependent methyltransferase
MLVNRNGRDVMCLHCGWHGKSFFETSRKRCPQCGSLPRTRLIAHAIRHFAIHLDYTDLLIVGPNIQEVVYLSTHFMLRTFLRVDVRKAGLINYQADLTNPSDLKTESVDTIIIWHVLEHIPDDRAAIEQMFRILRPGGRVLVSVPIHPEGREKTFEDPAIPRADYARVHGHFDHVRSCGLDYGDRFSDAGFEVHMLNVQHDVNESDRDFFGFAAKDVVWCCVKPSLGQPKG